MQAFCSSSAATAKFSFAARARIAIAHSETSQRMSVIRLDRHGFTVSVAANAVLPPLWLPRPAQILSGDETLCDLRLAARAPAQPNGHTVELTMQPSRADDDLSFWQALRAHRHLYPEMPGSAEIVAHQPGEREAVEESRRPEAASTVLNRSHTTNSQRPNAALRLESKYGDIGCEVLFKLLDNNDALFFSGWLEYHFAELAAHARAASCPADLHDIDQHRAGTAVKIGFSYRRGSQTVQRTTHEVCKRTVQEMERLFGISPRYELLDMRDDPLCSASYTSPPMNVHRTQHTTPTGAGP